MPSPTMRAIYLTGHGGDEVVTIGERPVPDRLPGQALVRVRAATLNRVDLYMRDSGAGITHRLPQIMGLDAAGTVEAVDADEPLLRPGQPVVLHPAIGCERCEFCLRGDGVLCTGVSYLGEQRDGTLAGYVSLPARNVFPKPEFLTWAEAAALAVNHLTAWRMLFTKARLRPWSCALRLPTMEPRRTLPKLSITFFKFIPRDLGAGLIPGDPGGEGTQPPLVKAPACEAKIYSPCFLQHGRLGGRLTTTATKACSES